MFRHEVWHTVKGSVMGSKSRWNSSIETKTKMIKIIITSWVPCEKFILAIQRPLLISFTSVSTVLEAGPGYVCV